MTYFPRATLIMGAPGILLFGDQSLASIIFQRQLTEFVVLNRDRLWPRYIHDA